MNLTKETLIKAVSDPVVAGASIDQNTTILDMSGFDGVAFIVPITDSVATAVATLKAEQNSANSDTGMTAITGATATLTCAVNDDLNGQVLIVDVNKPVERYVQGVLTSATANIAYGNVIAVQYNGCKFPEEYASTIGDVTFVVGS